MTILKRLFVIVGISLALASCATVKTGIDNTARPGDTATAIVVGCVKVDYNGAKFKTGLSLIHVSPYVSAASVEKNQFISGKFAIMAHIDGDGYFAVSLPPDRYYIVEFGYITEPLLPGFRSYMPLYMPILGSTTFYPPSIFTFDVEPGKATYIGTLYSRFSETPSEPGNLFKLGMTVTDDAELAKRWLAQKHPQWQTSLTTKLVVQLPAN